MRLKVKTVAGREAEIDVDPDLPLAVARAQAASALELDAEPSFVCKGRLLPASDDARTVREVGLPGGEEGGFVVAVTSRSDATSSSPAGGASAEKGVATGSTPSAAAASELAHQMQIEEDERAARRVQEDMDGELAREEQVRQTFGDSKAAEIANTPRLVHLRGELPNCAGGPQGLTWIPLMVDTGAQFSVLTSGLTERLGLTAQLDRSAAGIAGGVGQARILGKLRNITVRFGELDLAVDFAVLDGSQMPHANLAILGLDQLAVHHMVVDFDTRVVRIGGCEGYVVRMLEQYELPPEFRPDAALAQRCTVQ